MFVDDHAPKKFPPLETIKSFERVVGPNFHPVRVLIRNAHSHFHHKRGNNDREHEVDRERNKEITEFAGQTTKLSCLIINRLFLEAYIDNTYVKLLLEYLNRISAKNREKN